MDMGGASNYTPAALVMCAREESQCPAKTKFHHSVPSTMHRVRTVGALNPIVRSFFSMGKLFKEKTRRLRRLAW